MRLDITPHENPSYNCLDVLILTLARNWGIEHRLMFADAWRFRYDKAPSDATAISFEDVLDVKELVENRDIEAALCRHHGLVIRKHPMPDIGRAVTFVKSELAEGLPVALRVDAFHCHWSSAFRKYHLEHYCLAIGIDDAEQNLIVIDPYLIMDVAEFPIATYAETLRDCLSFRRDPSEPRPPDWRNLVHGSATSMLGRFQEMRDLAADIEAHLDFHQEVARHEDPYASFLVMYFKTLSFSRLNYAECLAHLGELARRNDVVQAAAEMQQQGNNLFKIFLLLMKLSLTPERFKAQDIASKLFEVADQEEALANKLVTMTRAVDGEMRSGAVVEAL